MINNFGLPTCIILEGQNNNWQSFNNIWRKSIPRDKYFKQKILYENIILFLKNPWIVYFFEDVEFGLTHYYDNITS